MIFCCPRQGQLNETISLFMKELQKLHIGTMADMQTPPRHVDAFEIISTKGFAKPSWSESINTGHHGSSLSWNPIVEFRSPESD